MNLQVDVERVLLAHKAVRAELLAERTHRGHWVGHLASSPVATAAAISALVTSHRRDTGNTLQEALAADGQPIEHIVQCDLSELLLESVHWLARHQNPDGGWGDCDMAQSNLAATMLVQAAFRMTGVPAKYADLVGRADDYIAAQGGATALRREADNKTFVAAVLAHCALAGIVPWRQVPALPFELACLPKRWLRHVEMPYPRLAIPVLLAVGGMKFHHHPPTNPLWRLLRRSMRTKSMAILGSLQAADDSFLASTTLTAFVVTSLASMGYQDHAIVRRGIEFLLSSVRGDASWPVRTNHAVTNTALVLNTFAAEAQGAAIRPVAAGQPQREDWHDAAHAADTVTDVAIETSVAESQRANEIARGNQTAFSEDCLSWLLDNQHRERNPLTEVPAGGWAWSDAPGALPNTVSTAGALIALADWRRRDDGSQRNRIDRAGGLGVEWLLDLQDEDGGWPTFYGDDGTDRRDESGTDVAAHALRALAAWQHIGPIERTQSMDRIGAAIERGWKYLESQQQDDGSFSPLWFGNEYQPDDDNPVCGTAEVLIACGELQRLNTELARRAARWLVLAQHSTGGWGPPRAPRDYSAAEKDGFRAWRGNETMEKFCSVEETALAVTALLPLVNSLQGASPAVSSGLTWLAAAVEQDAHRRPAVIGFYLSKLWYHERLYPLVFAAGAFSRAIGQLAPQPHEVASVAST